MKKRTLVCVVLLVLASSTAFAGWVFTESSEGDKQMSYIQQNRMKFVRADQIAIFDLTENIVCFANPKDKTFWTGTPDEYVAQVKKGIENMEKKMDEQLAQLPPEQRESIKKALNNQNKSETGKKPLKVEIKSAGEAGKIAGYSVEKFEILINGQVRQEQWIAKDIKASREIDVKKFANLMAMFRSGLDHRNEQEALLSPEVLDLLNKGWPLKRVDYDEDGYRETEDTVKAEETQVPASTFEPPKDYRKVSMADIFNNKENAPKEKSSK